MRNSGVRLWYLILVAGLLTACAGPSKIHKTELNQKLAVRDWNAAVADVEEGKDSEYGEKNSVLYWLDKAAVLHNAGRHQESDALLDLAERRMEELFTTSLSRKAGSFLINDNTEQYRGEIHERTLLHVMRALNYAYLHKHEDAVVEARKVTAFLAEMRSRLGEKSPFRDDAFAEYIASLIFDDDGRRDDSRIAMANAVTTAAWFPAEISASPVIADNIVPLGPKDGELVFLHYAGTAPRQESVTFQVAWNDAVAVVRADSEGQGNAQVNNALAAGLIGNAITVAYPSFVQDPYVIHNARIEVGGQSAQTELVEDVTALAKRLYDEKLPAIKVKAVARATIKFVLAKIAEDAVTRQAGSSWGALAGVIARAGAAASEVADTRGWSTLPAQFWMTRVRLDEGTHPIKVSYFDENGAQVQEEVLAPVEIKRGHRTYLHVRTAR
jgi:hypothetical protein